MSLGTMEQRTEGMKRQAQELIEQAYNRGFKAGWEDRQDWEKDQADRLIEKGRNEAWEAAKKLYFPVEDGGLSGDNIRKIFGNISLVEIVRNFSASEAISKIKAYEAQKQEEDKEIKVGDEVVTEAGDKGVVIGISNNDVSLFIPAWNISQVTHKICCKKTGRTFPQISEVLKKLQEGE